MLTPMARSVVAWFRAKSPVHGTATELYGAIVTQARQPGFYAEYRVPDTPEGRYEVLVLHVFLVLDRLKANGTSDAHNLAQHLTEVFVEDMDGSMREMGVGDLAVPRKVKKAAAGLFDRSHAYGTALKAPESQPLEALLKSSIAQSGQGDGFIAAQLADYARRASRHLSQLSTQDLLDGRVSFPRPTEGSGITHPAA
jgi:cytochrome b pre-mRNA-processing protein 3